MPMNSPFNQRGITMVEALVSLVVLSVAVLGIARTQILGLAQNKSAMLRSIATIKAYEMADRVRANPDGVIAHAYDSLSGSGSPQSCSSACSPAQMAAADFSDWAADLAAQLPGGTGTIQATGAGGAQVFTISVQWNDDKSGIPTNFTTSFTP